MKDQTVNLGHEKLQIVHTAMILIFTQKEYYDFQN